MNQDVRILRQLAARAADYAADEANVERARLYRAVNDRHMIRPVVLLDEIPWNELSSLDELRLRCQDPDYRAMETYLRREIYLWEHAQADRILRPYFPVNKVVHIPSIGLSVREQALGKESGGIYAHHYINQLRTDEDVEKLHAPTITYDHAASVQKLAKAADALGDVMPVKLVGAETGYALGLKTWDDVAMLMGPEQILYELIDRPEFMHRIARRFCDISLSVIRQIEALGLLDADQHLIHCTPALSDDLQAGVDRSRVTLDHCWGRGLAQIFASVSKRMRDEFDIDYQIEAMKPFGAVYYGCCEPLHNMIDILERIPNLRKISITPWADPDAAADAMGSRYVMSWKPNPAFALDVDAGEEAIRSEFSRALAAAKRNNTSMDIVLKDISSVSGDPRNLEKWTRIAMEMACGW